VAAQALITGQGDQKRTLVVVFLRGAADGLSLVAPVQEPAYYAARTFLAVAEKEALPLNGYFGLNPLLKQLHPYYQDGQLAIIHAAGSEDDTRSHFEAQDLMEHGGIAAGGWLGRFLRYGSATASSALAALALGATMPEALRGAPAATVLQSPEQFALGGDTTALTAQLQALYRATPGPLAAAGRDTLSALERLEKLRTAAYTPERGAQYPEGAFGSRLLQAARLIKARVGLEAVAIDLEGWDSHFTQKTLIEPLMRQLAAGLGAFAQDLGARLATVSVVVMTEFGRRVQENSSFGTDHGRGSVMLVLGGGVKGGQLAGRWPGLERDILEGPGDVPVANNYRDVLAPVLMRHGAEAHLGIIFPNFKRAPLNI
jgi:uncharacterized protein (DUF1501 family)